jgi:hypothetical protein
VKLQMPSESSRHEPLLVGGELIQALADRIGDPDPVHGYAELPVDVAEQLHQYQLLNTVRNIRLRRSLTEAVQVLNQAGIVPMLFKGSFQARSRWRDSEAALRAIERAARRVGLKNASERIRGRPGYEPLR